MTDTITAPAARTGSAAVRDGTGRSRHPVDTEEPR